MAWPERKNDHFDWTEEESEGWKTREKLERKTSTTRRGRSLANWGVVGVAEFRRRCGS